MAFNTVTITTSATKILSQVTGGGARTGAIVTNTTNADVFLGFDSNVTTANGFPIGEDDVWETNEPRCYQGDLFGIVSSGTADVRFQETK